jgi:hypothetical protein
VRSPTSVDPGHEETEEPFLLSHQLGRRLNLSQRHYGALADLRGQRHGANLALARSEAPNSTSADGLNGSRETTRLRILIPGAAGIETRAAHNRSPGLTLRSAIPVLDQTDGPAVCPNVSPPPTSTHAGSERREHHRRDLGTGERRQDWRRPRRRRLGRGSMTTGGRSYTNDSPPPGRR